MPLRSQNNNVHAQTHTNTHKQPTNITQPRQGMPAILDPDSISVIWLRNSPLLHIHKVLIRKAPCMHAAVGVAASVATSVAARWSCNRMDARWLLSNVHQQWSYRVERSKVSRPRFLKLEFQLPNALVLFAIRRLVGAISAFQLRDFTDKECDLVGLVRHDAVLVLELGLDVGQSVAECRGRAAGAGCRCWGRCR
jgi:hypothetical protein